MTLQTQQPTPEHSLVVLTDEQRRRVADALEDAQSENTRKNYASQRRKFRARCEREEQLALPASPEVVAAYAAELADDGKNMSTVRLLSNRELHGAARLIWKETAPKRGWLDIVLPSVLSDAGLHVSEAASPRRRNVLNAEDGAGLVYIERSKANAHEATVSPCDSRPGAR